MQAIILKIVIALIPLLEAEAHDIILALVAKCQAKNAENKIL